MITSHDHPLRALEFPHGTDAPPPVSASLGESVEQEIARLTWTVLDGEATYHERQRLAALVESQHARRRA